MALSHCGWKKMAILTLSQMKPRNYRDILYEPRRPYLLQSKKCFRCHSLRAKTTAIQYSRGQLNTGQCSGCAAGKGPWEYRVFVFFSSLFPLVRKILQNREFSPFIASQVCLPRTQPKRTSRFHCSTTALSMPQTIYV